MAIAVLGADRARFEVLLQKLMSTANEERGQAETLFTECKQQPDLLVRKLIETLRTSQAVELRGLCAVLLRKVITKDDVSLWPQLSPVMQEAVKAELLLCIQQEEVRSIWKKVCDTVSELAAGIFEEGLWPQLLPFMFQCVSSRQDRLMESSLLIFAQLAQYVGPSLVPHIATLHGLLQQCLSSGVGSDVRIAALRASASFVQTLESPSDREKFQDLLPGMMQTLSLALESHEEVAAQEALELFIEIAGTEPRFLRRRLAEVVAAMMSVAEAESLEEATRHLAVEFLITLAEAREQAPGMMRKLPNFVEHLFVTLMAMLLRVEDDASWHSADSEDENAGESADYEVAQECLDRLAISMGANSLLPAVSRLLPQFLADPAWEKRHAALICLAQIAEGCAKGMRKNLEPVLGMILAAFVDPHPRTRWAAINAIGQLSTDLGPDLQEKFHQQVIPALVAAMDDFNNPRVQAHAAAAILNFSEASTPTILAPYLDGVVSKLLVLLQNGKKMVQEGALTALAAVADCGQEHFQKYYDTVMPYLIAILMNANDSEHRLLRAKSMECISLVGMAVGKEKFRDDAKRVMEVLMGLQVAEMEADDPTISYMLQAWARLCKSLGQEFLPYMGVVMPPLLHSVQLKPDVTIVDADSDDGGDDDDDESIETITIGDKKIGIRTSVLEEKATACNMLCCYVDELREGFYPWIDEVAPIMVPLLKFYFHEEVRKAAVSAMPELLRAGKLAWDKGLATGRDHTYVKQLTDYLVAPLVEAIRKEPEPEIVASMLEALSECIQVAGPLLDMAQVEAIVAELEFVLKSSSERKAERAKRRQADTFDEEDQELLEEENEQEDEVFEQVGEVLGTLMKTYKGSFEPLFNPLQETIMLMLGKDRTRDERRIAICIFDDMAEHFGELAPKYYPRFMPLILEACVEEGSPDVRQAAVFGVGVCAQYGGMAFKAYVNVALQQVVRIIMEPAAQDTEGSREAIDNAVSALGKIFEFHQDGYDPAQFVTLWLDHLPLRADLIEAKVVHEQLCSLLERSDQRVVGENNKNLPRIVVIFAEILSGGKDLATEQTVARIVTLLRQLQQTLPPDALAATWASLQPQQQATLHAFLSATPPLHQNSS